VYEIFFQEIFPLRAPVVETGKFKWQHIVTRLLVTLDKNLSEIGWVFWQLLLLLSLALPSKHKANIL